MYNKRCSIRNELSLLHRVGLLLLTVVAVAQRTQYPKVVVRYMQMSVLFTGKHEEKGRTQARITKKHKVSLHV